MRQSAANAPVQRWAVPAPTPNAPLRKEVERETDAPEGNLVIVERCARERQRLFSCREYGWVGSAHILNSTRYGNPASHVQRFPYWGMVGSVLPTYWQAPDTVRQTGRLRHFEFLKVSVAMSRGN